MGSAHMHQYLPIIHCGEMAANSILFHQCDVIEFLAKENSSAEDIFD
jgi:hypothetical protein